MTTVPLPQGPYHNTGKLKASLCAGNGGRTHQWFGGTLWQKDLRDSHHYHNTIEDRASHPREVNARSGRENELSSIGKAPRATGGERYNVMLSNYVKLGVFRGQGAS